MRKHLRDNIDEPNDDSYYCPNEESYYIHLSFDNKDESINDEDETYSVSIKGTRIKVGTDFENVVYFGRALNHCAISNEFDYFI